MADILKSHQPLTHCSFHIYTEVIHAHEGINKGTKMQIKSRDMNLSLFLEFQGGFEEIPEQILHHNSQREGEDFEKMGYHSTAWFLIYTEPGIIADM